MLARRQMLVCGAAAMALSACASLNYSSTENPTHVTLVGSQVYVYSFLDIRNSEFGTRMVRAANEQIVEGLGARGVQSEFITYHQTEAGMATTSEGGSMVIPIDQIVASRRAYEQQIGADFRLLVIPSQMLVNSAAHDFEVRWVLVDTSDNRTVWQSTLRGSRTVWVGGNDSDPENRARRFVEGLFVQMQQRGLFAPATPVLSAT